MFCPNCGSQLPDDAAFCGACGGKVADRTVGASALIAQRTMVPTHAAQTKSLPIDRLRNAVRSGGRPTKKLRFMIVGVIVIVLVVAMVVFGTNTCAQQRSASHESAYEVANELSDVAEKFLTSDHTVADQAEAVTTVFGMMPEGTEKALVDALGFKSADEAIEELNSYEHWDKLMEVAGCVDVTFRPNNGDRLSKDGLKPIQNELDDLGLDYYVEAAVPLGTKVKVTQSNKDFGLTRGDTPYLYSTAFYAIEVDDEWYLWVQYLENTYNSAHYLDEDNM